MPRSDKYWAFVASLAQTLTLAHELASENDGAADAAMKHLRPCGKEVLAWSRNRLANEQRERVGTIEVLALLDK